jgi:hypothetical protein
MPETNSQDAAFLHFDKTVIDICDEIDKEARATVKSPRFPPAPLLQDSRNEESRGRFDTAATGVFTAAIELGIPRDEVETKVKKAAASLEKLIAVRWWQRFHVESKTDVERDQVVAEFELLWKECRGSSQDVVRLRLGTPVRRKRHERADERPVPPAIAALTDPQFRGAATRCWRACCRIMRIIDDWHVWFNELRIHGDADPSEPSRWSEEAFRLLHVLIQNHATMPPFDGGDVARIADMLPPLPPPQFGWQEDMRWSADYYLGMRHPLTRELVREGKLSLSNQLYGRTRGLRDMLAEFPHEAIRPTPLHANSAIQNGTEAAEARRLAPENKNGAYDPSEREPHTLGELIRFGEYAAAFARAPAQVVKPPVQAIDRDYQFVEFYCIENFGTMGVDSVRRLQARYAIATGKTVDEIHATTLREVAEHFRRPLGQGQTLPPQSVKRPALIDGTDAEKGLNGETPAKKSKRSTERGEGRQKLIAVLTKHHQFGDACALNLEPVGNNDLAEMADVAISTASGFFKSEFDGHAKYRAICRDPNKLANSIKLLNGEFSPHSLYGRRPPGEDDRGDKTDE